MWYVFALFLPLYPQVYFVLESLLYIFTVQEWLFHCTWIISAFLVRYDCTSYNILWVHMFVCVIQYNVWLYFILGIFSCISSIYGLLFHGIVVTFTFLLICLWMLYICLLKYVGVLHTIWYLLLLRTKNI